jgi:predicted nucleotidyltransferase
MLIYVQITEQLFRKMSINYTRVTMAVLEILGKDPNTSLHVREVAERAKVSVGSASIVLGTLQRSGLLTVEERGNMKFYRIDLTDPRARQFKVLFNVYRLKPLADRLSGEADQVVLFGSAADGTDTIDSDVDLLILTQHENVVREILRKFQREYDRPLSPIIMNANDYARLRKRDTSLYQNIGRGKVLWERE